MFLKQYVLIFIALLHHLSLFSQDSLSNLNHKRQKAALYTGLGGTVLLHSALYQMWYKDYPGSSFHFFNDNKEWLQMDKIGHSYSAYYLSLTGIEVSKWAGVKKKNQWKWGLYGLIFQTPIEVFDGFSSGWGASSGDLIANTLGSGLCIAQHALWNEQKIYMKYSFTPSVYSTIRPNVLGKTYTNQMLKDYNGQTYWLTYSPFKNPKINYLGFAFGYGANGLIGGFENKWTGSNNIQNDKTDIERYRQFYWSLDINFSKIKTKNKFLKKAFFVLNCIKIPSPALEFSRGKFRGHWMKF